MDASYHELYASTAIVSNFAAYFVVVIAASLIASALASRKNVLELLQTKD